MKGRTVGRKRLPFSTIVSMTLIRKRGLWQMDGCVKSYGC